MVWIRIASLLMLLGVMLGAFGAHALRGKITEHYLEVYKTGVLYHLIHALGLFVIAWASTITKDGQVIWAGYFLLAGIILFSGSLYALSITSIKWLGAITPLGGVCFLVGWFLLMTSKF